MHDALRMHNNVNLIIGHIKQPMCLHNLQSLVRQGGGIKRHLRPHAPVGMLEALRQGYVFQLTALLAAEGTAARRNDQALDLLFCTAAQGLENSTVLAVNWCQADAMLTHCRHNQTARSNQRFLIRQRNVLAAFNSRQRRTQTGVADHRGQHGICSVIRCRRQQALVTGKNLRLAMIACCQTRCSVLIAQNSNIRLKLTNLLLQQLVASVCGQGTHL